METLSDEEVLQSLTRMLRQMTGTDPARARLCLVRLGVRPLKGNLAL